MLNRPQKEDLLTAEAGGRATPAQPWPGTQAYTEFCSLYPRTRTSVSAMRVHES